MFRQGGWSFLGLGGYDVGTLGQLGGFFLARFGAQLPAMAFAAFIISLADFQRPLRVAFSVTFGLHLFLLGLQAIRWPWAQFPHLDQSIPALCELVELSLIVGCTVFFTWLITGLFRRGFRR